jgi:hypothetical protein
MCAPSRRATKSRSPSGRSHFGDTRRPPTAMIASIAAVIYIIISVLLATLLLALGAGLSWRTLTLGRADTGPVGIEGRLLLLWQAFGVLVWALIVAVRARFVLPQYLVYARGMMWIVVVYDAIAALSYLLSKSRWARMVWFPVLLALTICAGLVVRYAT